MHSYKDILKISVQKIIPRRPFSLYHQFTNGSMWRLMCQAAENRDKARVHAERSECKPENVPEHPEKTTENKEPIFIVIIIIVWKQHKSTL